MSIKDQDTDWSDPPTITAHGEVLQKTNEREKVACVLRLVSGDGAPAHFPIRSDEIIVGRSPDAGIRIQSAELSRKHLLICKRGKQHHCKDLDSRNGVYLNGLRIHSAVLRDGDTLQLGQSIFTFHEGRQ